MRDIDDYYLPAIQREFVWPSFKIINLFDSLLRGYPIGTFLFWDVREPEIHEFTFYNLIRNYDERDSTNEKVNLTNKNKCTGILDGQQRITSLLIGLLGSYIEKIKHKRTNDPTAYPERKLYINLLHNPQQETEQKYQIRFLTREQANPDDQAYWFSFDKILAIRNEDDLFVFRKGTEHGENHVFEKNINTVFRTFHEKKAITYFLCTEQDLDEVLTVFVRLNTGGTPLSYSDLLLSLATAAWKQHDARESIDGLVKELNQQCGAKFSFDKDLVLKTLLVASDKDIRFKASNVRKKHQLENIWEPVRDSLKLTIRLLARFGFNQDNLLASRAIIPIVYYIYKKRHTEAFLDRSQYCDQRNEIRIWLLTMILGKVFRGHTDNILTTIRKVIKEAVENGKEEFPAQEINQELNYRKELVFTEISIQQLIDDTAYGSQYAFALLSLLCKEFDYDNIIFDVDHIHPKAKFNNKDLSIAGVKPEEIDFYLKHYNSLGNLQLLPRSINQEKKLKPFEDWLKDQKNPKSIIERNFIPDVDLSLTNFKEFYETRKNILKSELKKLLGITETDSQAPISSDDVNAYELSDSEYSYDSL